MKINTSPGSGKPKAEKVRMTQDQKNQYEYNKRVAKLANTDYMSYGLYDKAKDSKEAGSASQKAWNNYNKAWKKEYNKEYYQKNNDYWKKRYEESLKKAASYLTVDSHPNPANIGITSPAARYGSSGLNELIGKVQTGNLGAQSKFVSDGRKAVADALVALNNYERAEKEQKDYNNFISVQTRQTPVSDLWKSGAKSIVNAGKSFLDNWKSGLKSIFS